MSRAIVTFAVGADYRRLLDIALPTFAVFADRHDYDLIVADVPAQPRPPSWWKIPAIQAALGDGYDEVLYLDADVVIVDPSRDLEVPFGYWQALVEHHTQDGAVPNCGVWMLRPPMLNELERIWTMIRYLNHGWWEQAALCELLGYTGRPLAHTQTTELYENTCFLDPGWNVHRDDVRAPDHVRIQHATMWPNRAGIMRQWAEHSHQAAGVPA